MKKITSILIVVGALSLTAMAFNINDVPSPQINMTTTTNKIGTNNVVCGTTKSPTTGIFWTNSFTSSYTNLTLVDQTGAKDLALEFTSGITATNAVAGVTTVAAWQLARNLRGGTSTNLNGSPMKFELFAIVSNTIPVNALVSTPTVVNLSSAPTTPTGVSVQTSFNKGAIQDIYVYSVTLYTNGVANTSAVGTNCTVYAKPL